MDTKKLEDLPNIGKTLAEKLRMVEITNPDELLLIGSSNAFIRIATIDDSACYNMLCALEGAVQGIRWHSLSPEIKQELKYLYNVLKG